IQENDAVIGSIIKAAGNDLEIKSGATSALVFTGAAVAAQGALSVAGDLTVTGNDIISSSTTAITLDGADVEVVGDLTVTGADIVVGPNADADRSIKFGHIANPVIMGLDDDQNVFAIHTAAAFTADNDIELAADGTVTFNGKLLLPDGTQTAPAIGRLSGSGNTRAGIIFMDNIDGGGIGSVAITASGVKQFYFTDGFVQPVVNKDIALGKAAYRWSNVHTYGTRLYADANNRYVHLKAPDNLSSPAWELTLPDNDGDANQVLITDGDGVTSWGVSATATALAATGNIAMTGDVAWNVDFNGAGVTAAGTIQANAVEGSMLNTDVISG
ncbi:uncharacterized protein METZ01_LOCUS341309, partial [marine metagenome]